MYFYLCRVLSKATKILLIVEPLSDEWKHTLAELPLGNAAVLVVSSLDIVAKTSAALGAASAFEPVKLEMSSVERSL